MNDSENVATFIADFNRLHRLLKELLHDQDVSFASAVQKLVKTHPIIRDHQLDLDAIRELRNLLVHEKISSTGELAIPTQSTVTLLKDIIAQIEQPKTVALFKKAVVTFSHADSLAHVLNVMAKQQYSQYPVFENDQLVGVLSAKVITHWLSQQSLAKINFQQITCADILKHNKTKPLTTKNFISSDVTINEIDELFFNLLQQNELPILLISNKTKDIHKKDIQGIITPWDLPQISKEASVNK